jgi:hypothetical protein
VVNEGRAGEHRDDVLDIVLSREGDVAGVSRRRELLARGAAGQELAGVLAAGPPEDLSGGRLGGAGSVRAEGGDDGAGPEQIFEGGPQSAAGPALPAAMMTAGLLAVPYPWCSSQRATAVALRRHPASTCLLAAAAAMAEPLGDGRTSRAGSGPLSRLAGDSDQG